MCDTLPEDICGTTDGGMCQRIQDVSDPPVVAERYELGKTTDQLNVAGEHTL